MKRALTVSLLIGATLPGCTVGPGYSTPVVLTPERFAGADAPGLSHDRAALSRWWATLNDPLLDTLIERAVASNLDLRVAQARVREARALRRVVAADDQPRVDAAAGYSRTRPSENAFPVGVPNAVSGVVGGGSPASNGGLDGSQNLFQTGFDASWELDVFGRVRRSVEAAEADIDAAIEARRDVLVTMLAEVARNYVEVRGAQARLVIARQNIAAQADSLTLAEARFGAGLTGELDVAQARALLATTRSQVPVLETLAAQGSHRLGVLLGLEPRALSVELGRGAPIPATPPLVPAGLPSDLLRRRPDIRQAERELAAATARIGAAIADLFPRFSLTGSFGFESKEAEHLPEGDARFWSVGPTVRWPILDGGRIRANIRVQDAREEQAAARYEHAVLRALEDVENSLVAYTQTKARRTALAEAVEANQRAVDLSQELYTRGLTGFLNVLESQRSLFTSQDQLVDADRAVTANLIALYKALGGGWEQ